MRGNEINSGFCETMFRATEFQTTFIKYSSGKCMTLKLNTHVTSFPMRKNMCVQSDKNSTHLERAGYIMTPNH